MALPTDVATLYAWYKAGSLSLNEGDLVTSWLDSSGNGRTMASTGAARPFYRVNQLSGYPAVDFPTGGATFLSNVSNFRTDLVSHTMFAVVSMYPYGATYGAIIGGNGGDASESLFFPGTSDQSIKKRYYTNTDTRVYASTAMPESQWHYCCGFQDGASTIGISVDGGSETTAATGTRHATYPENGVFSIGLDGGAYSCFRTTELIVYSSSLSAGDKTLINTYLRDKYFSAAPGQQEQIRDALSRRLWLLRRPTGIFEVTAPLWMLDADILDRIALEARVGPAPGAVGWGGKKWQRRDFSVQRIDVDPGAGTVKLQLLDRRPLDVLFWDSARTDERNTSARQAGVARLSMGNGFTFSRLSKAWIENPSDPTAVVECQQTERAINQTGEYLEEARSNELTRSSFASGTTGITLGGTGTNGSAITADTDDLMFGSETTSNSLEFLAGSPHAANLYAKWSTASIAANTKVCVSIDHKTDNGEALLFQLTRDIDSNYWNDSTGAWGAAVDNQLPTVSTRNAGSRYVSKVIDVGAGATVLNLFVFLASGGTASRISHLYHVQLEKGTFPTSRIVTDGAVVTRVKTQLSHEVTTSAQMYNPVLGAFWCQVTPDWSSADIGSTEDMYLYWMETNDGDDHDALYYDASAGAWTFERKVGANTYTATKTASVTRGTTYSIGSRWTGIEAELSLSAYTISVFVNGVKGTDASGAQFLLVEPPPDTLYRGSDSSFAKHANGAIREVRIFPYVPTDEEMARLP